MLREVSMWPELLRSEEARCAESGFVAGVVSIDLAGSDATADTERRVSQVLDSCMRWTDRACHLGDEQIGLLLIPLRRVGEIAERACALYDAFRAAGFEPRIGFALRHDGDGLLGAAARADAAAARPTTGQHSPA